MRCAAAAGESVSKAIVICGSGNCTAATCMRSPQSSSFWPFDSIAKTVWPGVWPGAATARMPGKRSVEPVNAFTLLPAT